jgi:hypothetical protein
MQLFGTFARHILCTLVVLVMAAAPVRLGGAAATMPEPAAAASECAKETCSCDKAKPECIVSAVCASQCAGSPATINPQMAVPVTLTAAFDRQMAGEPPSHTPHPLRRPPRA